MKKGNARLIKAYTAILIGLLLSITASGQKIRKMKGCMGTYDTIMKAMVTTTPEVQPVFPGGVEALSGFLMQNMHYNQGNDNLQGRINLEFIIDTNGAIRNTRITNKLPEAYTMIDKEGIRVLESMPCWIPGTYRGRKVNVEMFLPITICLLDQ